MKTTQALLIAVAFVPLGAAGVVSVYFGRGAQHAKHYRAHFAELEARGVLPPEAELQPVATPLAKEIRSELARIRETLVGEADDASALRDELALHQAEWGSQDHRRAQAWVDERSAFFEAVDDLTSNRVATLAVGEGQRVVTNVPKLRELRSAAQALVARARLLAENNQDERAARSFAQGMVLVKLSSDGTMLSSLLGLAVRRYLWSEAAALAEAEILEPRLLLEALGPELQSNFDAAEVDRILRFELAGLRGVEPKTPCLSEGPMSFLEYPREAERMLEGLAAREQLLELVPLRGEEFEARRRLLLEHLSEEDPLLVSQALGFLESTRREHSAEVLFRVALAAYACRAADGSWPDSLDDLAPFLGGGVPVDPWTGESFPYLRQGDTWVLGPCGFTVAGELEAQERAREAYVLR